MTLLTALDMSDHENVKDALHALNGAIGDAAKAAWVDRYGRACAEHCRDIDPNARADELKAAYDDADEARAESARLSRIVERAMEMADKLNPAPGYDEIFAYLQDHIEP